MRVFEDKTAADQTGVVLDRGSVQQPKTSRIDEDFGALWSFKHVIAIVGRLFPAEHVLEPRAAAGLEPDPQAALLHVLLRQQFPDLSRSAFANLNHAS